MPDSGEFNETSHCGGMVAFDIKTDGSRLSYSVSVSHSRPTPASCLPYTPFLMANPSVTSMLAESANYGIRRPPLLAFPCS